MTRSASSASRQRRRPPCRPGTDTGRLRGLGLVGPAGRRRARRGRRRGDVARGRSGRRTGPDATARRPRRGGAGRPPDVADAVERERAARAGAVLVRRWRLHDHAGRGGRAAAHWSDVAAGLRRRRRRPQHAGPHAQRRPGRDRCGAPARHRRRRAVPAGGALPDARLGPCWPCWATIPTTSTASTRPPWRRGQASGTRRTPSSRATLLGLADDARDGLAGDALVVHFDVDVVDGRELALANFPHYGTGVPVETAATVLRTLLTSDRRGRGRAHRGQPHA